MRIKVLSIALVITAACGRDPAVLLNAPPQLDGARVYVDGRLIGSLVTTHSYRHGAFAQQKEMAAPPRHEANIAIERLAPGIHRLRITKPGFADYHATFRTASPYVEVFVPDEAVRQIGS